MTERRISKLVPEVNFESLDSCADPDVEKAWHVEIERRVGQIERKEVQLIPGDEVFARLRRRSG